MSASNKLKTVEKKPTSRKTVKVVEVSTVRKKAAPKPLSKKVVAPKKSLPKTIKNSKTTAIKKITARKIPSKKTEIDEEVSIPTVPSLRLVEKAQIYRLWYKNNLSHYVANTARYGGYIFVALGTLLATSSYLLDKNPAALTAAVVCSDAICNEIPDAALPVGSPLVTFLTPLPVKLETDTEMLVKVENVTAVEVLLTNTLSGKQTILQPTETLADGTRRFFITFTDLEVSSYTLSAKVMVNKTTYQFTGPSFTVPALPIAEPTPEAVVIIDEEIESEKNTSTTTEITEENGEVIESIKKSPLPIAIILKQLDTSKYVTIKTGDFLPKTVEVYSKLEFSDEPIFLGLATLVQGEWVFSLTALDLPVAKHLIFAIFSVDGKTYQSEGVEYIPPSKEVLSIVTEDDINTLLQKVELGMETASVTPAIRLNFFTEFSSTSEAINSQELQLASAATINAIDSLMIDETDHLNDLLVRYASAIQGNNSYLINLADSMLTEHYKSLAHDVAIQLDDNSVVPSVSTILSLRYQTLKEKVKTFEISVKKNTSDLIARDSDHDGLSDFDEVSIYQTNPSVTDSDSDGVTDAIEVIKNFDPLNSDIKSSILPIQNIDEVIHDEVVSITSITPVVVKGYEEAPESIFAVVQGQSLPNTFISIVSYSSSVLGIIKTNETGKFTYTLEKELGDGDYTMIAALGDNFGSLVASSKPYKFTKQENIFSTNNGGGKHTVSAHEDFFSPTLLHNVIASIGVVAFGFILILLGQTLHSRRKIDISENTEQIA